MQLRPYQQESIDTCYLWLAEHDGNPCIVLPTGSGKTPVIASICRDIVQKYAGRVVVLAHVKELLQQTVDKLSKICPDISVGVYSAGLKRRDTDESVVVAGIQSIYKKADQLGKVDLIIVDEAHLIPTDGDGMYRHFLRDMKIINPHVRVIGLTATPYRLDCGYICGKDNIFQEICYEAGIADLIQQGYLTKPRSKSSAITPDTSGLHVRGGEFIPEEVEALMDDDALVEHASAEMVTLAKGREAVIVFCSSVKHAEHVSNELMTKHRIACPILTGDTPAIEREDLLAKFQRREIRCLANVNVLTTGFDAPHIDCVVLLRATLSPGLYYQMVGRGFRLSEGKQDCLVLDYGGNVLRHGPVDAIEVVTKRKGEGKAPTKVCPECREVVAAACKMCNSCGYVFPVESSVRHGARALGDAILSDDLPAVSQRTINVSRVTYQEYKKHGWVEGMPTTLKVTYYENKHELFGSVSEWVCIEHVGYAKDKARKWWKERTDETFPRSTRHAAQLANCGLLREPKTITVRKKAGEKFESVVSYTWGDDEKNMRCPGDDEDEDLEVVQLELDMLEDAPF